MSLPPMADRTSAGSSGPTLGCFPLAGCRDGAGRLALLERDLEGADTDEALVRQVLRSCVSEKKDTI